MSAVLLLDCSTITEDECDILGGHFTATGTNGSDVNNLVFINGSNSDTVTGVGLRFHKIPRFWHWPWKEDTLYAGGILTGNVNGGSVNGLISFNLVTSSFDTQPPLLSEATSMPYLLDQALLMYMLVEASPLLVRSAAQLSVCFPPRNGIGREVASVALRTQWSGEVRIHSLLVELYL